MYSKNLNGEFKENKLSIGIYSDRNSMGKAAAEDVANKMKELLKVKDNINMVFAAAPSQDEFLQELIKIEGIKWNCVNAFHMDEYIGMDENAPQKFGNFLKQRIFEKVNFKAVYYINGNAKDINEECKRYGELLKKNPIDIACMGIGENGHLAFNDPDMADFTDKLMLKQVTLDEKCRRQQVHDGNYKSIGDVPKIALTITIPALCSAEYKYVIVPGQTKKEAVKATIEGEISTSCPASYLRQCENTWLYLDKDSSSLLKFRTF